MADRGWIEPIVQRVVGQALESHTTQLRSELVRRVMEEIAASPAVAASGSASSTADLARAVSEIRIGSSQKEILRALLDSSSHYAARVALFVVKGSHASGWQARGFADCDALKDFALDSNAPAVVRSIAEHTAASVRAAEFDAHFTEKFGAPASGEAQILPLILKEKVAALLYADGGSAGALIDTGALEVLALATSAWLEVNTLRKQAHKDPSAAAEGAGHTSTVSEPAAAFSDPFAAHPPAFAMAAGASADSHATVAAAAPQSVPAVANTPPEVAAGPQTASVVVQSAAAPASAAEPLSTGHAQSEAAAEAPAAPGVSSAAAQDQEVHRKAQRFARLLVDEIKLYNQAKVAEGRKNKDLYDRLKETIEKSRATYQKRYGNTVAASGDYFQHELIRSLAEDDRSIMGPNFRA